MSSYEQVLQVPIHLDGNENKALLNSTQREKKYILRR